MRAHTLSMTSAPMPPQPAGRSSYVARGAQRRGDACISGKRRMSGMLFHRKATGIMLRALHVESHMQEAVIEHVRRVSDHWSYDALGRRGVIVAKLSRQRQLKKSGEFLSGAALCPRA